MFESLTRRLTDVITGLRGRKITEANVRDTLREVRVALIEADVALSVVKDFQTRVLEKALGAEVIEGVNAGQLLVKIFQDELTALMGPVDPEINWNKKRPTVILMAGLQGSGKTTTCGKLALRLRTRKDRRPLLVAADVQRPAAIEQLKVLGRQLDIPVFHDPTLSPPLICQAAVKQAASMGCDTVILDTAGRLQIDEAMMAEIKQVAKLTEPDEVFLVCDAMTGQDAVRSAQGFDQALALTGVILTKLDGDARGGAALSVKAVTGKPIKFVGTGEKLERLQEFEPGRMAQRILGMGDIVGLVETAQEQVDRDEQKRMQEALTQGTFSLDDFLKQLGMIKKMGSLRDLLGHIPGLGGRVDELGLEGNEISVVESMIQSMTYAERRRPEIINTSRRRRIAKGSGRSIEEVNDLLKQFKSMKEMMDGIYGQGGGFLGKFKAMRSLRRQMKAAQSQNGGALPPMPAGLAGHPNLGPPPAGGPEAAKRTKPVNKKDLQKKRKAERQRKRKNRKGK
ncbi:MAG: signal recognition particle protein [Planctomycetota bacterium]